MDKRKLDSESEETKFSSVFCPGFDYCDLCAFLWLDRQAKLEEGAPVMAEVEGG